MKLCLLLCFIYLLVFYKYTIVDVLSTSLFDFGFYSVEYGVFLVLDIFKRKCLEYAPLHWAYGYNSSFDERRATFIALIT